jgi:hypothetical protein
MCARFRWHHLLAAHRANIDDIYHPRIPAQGQFTRDPQYVNTFSIVRGRFVTSADGAVATLDQATARALGGEVAPVAELADFLKS